MVGRVSPLRAVCPPARYGAHGVTRPTLLLSALCCLAAPLHSPMVSRLLIQRISHSTQQASHRALAASHLQIQPTLLWIQRASHRESVVLPTRTRGISRWIPVPVRPRVWWGGGRETETPTTSS